MARMAQNGLRSGFRQFTIAGSTAVAQTELTQVACPACSNVMHVLLDAWVASSTYETRPCTYCFKAARLPEVTNEGE